MAIYLEDEIMGRMGVVNHEVIDTRFLQHVKWHLDNSGDMIITFTPYYIPYRYIDSNYVELVYTATTKVRP